MESAFKRFKAFVAYKIVSWELFREVQGKDLSDLKTWSEEDRRKYHADLIDGYVRNKRCHNLRVAYRDRFVPVSKQDENHEKAIHAATKNVQRYETLLEELHKRLSDLKAADIKEAGLETVTNLSQRKRVVKRQRKKTTVKKSAVALWKQEWTHLLDEAEADGERDAQTLYESVHKRLLDGITRLDPDLNSEIMETIVEVMIAGLSDLYNDTSKMTLKTWKDRTKQAAKSLNQKTDVELDDALEETIANVQGLKTAANKASPGSNTNVTTVSLLSGLEVPVNIAATLKETVDTRFKYVTEEDIRTVRGAELATTKADARVIRTLMIHLALRCVHSMGNFQLTSMGEAAQVLLAYVTLRDAKRLEDIMDAELPAWKAEEFYSSSAHIVASLPASLPDLQKSSEVVTEARFHRVLVSRISKFIRKTEDALLTGKLLLKTLAGKVEWGLVIWDPRAFIVDVHDTNMKDYRPYWTQALELHKIDRGEIIMEACFDALTNAQSRVLFQFPDLERLRQPWTLPTKDLTEIRARSNPFESPTYLERLFYKTIEAAPNVKGLLVEQTKHLLVEVPVPNPELLGSKGLIPEYFVEEMFPEGCFCDGWTRDEYSAQTDGFYVYGNAPQPSLSVNEYATRLCGREVKGDRVLIVYVVWEDGKRCIADMPPAWIEMLRTCAQRRKDRDDRRKNLLANLPGNVRVHYMTT